MTTTNVSAWTARIAAALVAADRDDLAEDTATVRSFVEGVVAPLRDSRSIAKKSAATWAAEYAEGTDENTIAEVVAIVADELTAQDFVDLAEDRAAIEAWAYELVDATDYGDMLRALREDRPAGDAMSRDEIVSEYIASVVAREDGTLAEFAQRVRVR